MPCWRLEIDGSQRGGCDANGRDARVGVDVEDGEKDGVKVFVSGTHAATFAFLRIHAAVGGWYFRTVLVIFSLID